MIYVTDVGQREHFEMLFTVSIKSFVLCFMTSCALQRHEVMHYHDFDGLPFYSSLRLQNGRVGFHLVIMAILKLTM